MNLLQGGKISFDRCKTSIIKSCQNVTRYLKDLEVLEDHYRKEEERREVERVMVALAKKRRPFVQIDAVAAWNMQHVKTHANVVVATVMPRAALARGWS
jgi:hypothetical protein